MMVASTILLVLFLLVSGLCRTKGETRALLDLSYQPRLTTSVVTETLQSTLAQHDTIDSIELDVSYSEMGNKGLAEITNYLASTEGVAISLTARMNRLTPDGVKGILYRLINSEEAKSDDLEKKNSNDQLSTVVSLDLGWNNLHPDEAGSKEFLTSLRKLVECPNCPRQLRLDCCGLGPGACRALGKGLMKRYESGVCTPLSLYLYGNKDIGDAGIAALAAAIREATFKSESVIFENLDLSGCNIGNVGADALALALESHPGCIEHLDLSNNDISDEGATAFGRALSSGGNGSIGCLNLSNNPNIGNSGAAALANAMGCGKINSLILRSCNVQADGAKAFGNMIKVLASNPTIDSVKLDLSGNPLGILRKVKKGQKYSASALKSKASATTASYLNFIGKKIKSSLKEVGWDGVAGSSAYSTESDDEEDERMGTDESSDSVDPSKARCGAKAFASTIVVGEHELTELTSPVVTMLKCELGLRHCYFDEGAADALASTILQAKERFGIQLIIDARMSAALEEELVDALALGGVSSRLEDMSERNMRALEVIRISEQRATQAADAVRRRTSYDNEEFTSINFDTDEDLESEFYSEREDLDGEY